jgi:hypothetical protein
MTTKDFILRLFICALLFTLGMILLADVKYRVKANPELRAAD